MPNTLKRTRNTEYTQEQVQEMFAKAASCESTPALANGGIFYTPNRPTKNDTPPPAPIKAPNPSLAATDEYLSPVDDPSDQEQNLLPPAIIRKLTDKTLIQIIIRNDPMMQLTEAEKREAEDDIGELEDLQIVDTSSPAAITAFVDNWLKADVHGNQVSGFNFALPPRLATTQEKELQLQGLTSIEDN